MDHNQKYILAIDQSTSGTKALLVNSEGAVIARSGMAHKQHFPQPGWVEHDPLEIYNNVIKVARSVLEQTGIHPAELAALTSRTSGKLR